MKKLDYDGRLLEGKNITKTVLSLIEETDFSERDQPLCDLLYIPHNYEYKSFYSQKCRN